MNEKGWNTSKLKFFHHPPPNKLNSERRWNKSYFKLRVLDSYRNTNKFKKMYTDRVAKMLGES